MITYGFSLQGKSHIRKGVVCQDAHVIESLSNGWYLLAVADGVGSAKYSEKGSQIATQMTAQYCMKHVVPDMDGTQMLSVLKKAYEIAFQQIETYCQNQNGKIEDYDTTLSVAIYTGTEVYFGHAGDGGIIIKDSDGKYEMITVPQKGEDGISVRPLRAGNESWEFGVVYKNVAAVLLATDGMLDALLPPLLSIKQMQENPMMKDKPMNIYVTLAEFFLNSACVFDNSNIQNPNQYIRDFLNEDLNNEQFNQCLYNGYASSFGAKTATAICNTIQQYNYCTWKIGKVDDDKTIVCAINENAEVFVKEPEYYAEPDWKALQQQFDRLAYPALYRDDKDVLLKNDGYAKLALKTDSGQSPLHSGDEEASLQLENKNHTENNASMSTAEQAQVRTIYQKNKKKGIIVNVICALAIIVVVATVFVVGIKVAKGTGDKAEELLAEVTTQELSKETEAHSMQKFRKEDKTEVETGDEWTTEKEVLGEDKLSTENNVKDITFVDQESTTETVNSEEVEPVVGETEIVLYGESYFFPCTLEDLGESFELEYESNGKESSCYKLDIDSDVEVLIETIEERGGIADEEDDTETSIDSENIMKKPNEKVKSISIALDDNSVGREQSESTMNSIISVNCSRNCVARLGMTEQEFVTCKQEIERKLKTCWIREMRISCLEYRMVYQGITYIVCVKDGIVTEMSLHLSDI